MSLWARIYTERRRVLLPLGVLIAANVAAFLLGVVPMRSSLAAAEIDEGASAAELAVARRASERALLASRSRHQADEQLKAFYTSVLPPDFATARKAATLWLEQTAVGAGLSFRSARFQLPEEIDDSRLSKATATVALVGRYAEMRAFLHEVEAADEFIVIERVEVAQSDATQLGRDAELALEIVVSTYFLTPSPR